MSNSDLIWFHSEYIIFWYVMINIYPLVICYIAIENGDL